MTKLMLARLRAAETVRNLHGAGAGATAAALIAATIQTVPHPHHLWVAGVIGFFSAFVNFKSSFKTLADPSEPKK